MLLLLAMVLLVFLVILHEFVLKKWIILSRLQKRFGDVDVVIFKWNSPQQHRNYIPNAFVADTRLRYRMWDDYNVLQLNELSYGMLSLILSGSQKIKQLAESTCELKVVKVHLHTTKYDVAAVVATIDDTLTPKALTILELPMIRI